MTEDTKPKGLELLRAHFPPNQISKLPQPTASKDVMDGLPKATCKECGQYHATSRIIHLDYVGHAALTDRLLDADPHWTWEPLAFSENGLPLIDEFGGLWIKLTVCGVTRLGYGDAGTKKPGPNAIKEAIGDAMRNGGMRFGCALNLWHKGELHVDDDAPPPAKKAPPPPPVPAPTMPETQLSDWLQTIEAAAIDELGDQKSAALTAASAAKDEAAYRAIRTAAAKRAKELGIV